MSLFDMAGQYFTNRVNRAMDPFRNPANYMDQRLDNRFGSLYETEEERRRREQQQAAEREAALLAPSGPIAPPAADMQYETQGLQEGPAGQFMSGFRQPSTTPFKQTLTIDPVTGQQKMKMEGDPRDFTAANPLTPTVSMPAQSVAGPMAPGVGPTPDELMREQEQRRQYALMMAQPAAPVAPPAGPVEMAAAPAATMTDVTAPTTGAIPPGMARNPETGELYTPLPAASAQVQPAAAPVAAPAAPEAATPMPATPSPFGGPTAGRLAEQAVMQYGNILKAIEDNPTKLLDMARDPNTADMWRRVYADRAKTLTESESNRNKGEAQGQVAAETGRGVDRIIRKTHEPNSVGFYAKQYLLRRLGLGKEADQELAKTSSSFQNVIGTDGRPYEIEVRGDGLLLAGYDSKGKKIDNSMLAEVGSMATLTKDGIPVAQRIRDRNNTEWTQVNTKQGPIFFDNARRRGIPEGPTVPITASTDINTQVAMANLRIRENYIKKGITNLQDAKKDYILREGAFGTSRNPLSEAEFEQVFAGQLSALPGLPSAAGPEATPGVPPTPAAAPAVTTAQPAAAQPAAAGAPAARPPGGPVPPTPLPTTAGGRAPGGGLVTAPTREVATAAAVAEAKPVAEIKGQLQAKDIKNQAFADSTYGLIRTINDEIKKSTGSGIGAGVDTLAALMGKGTEGAQAIAKLEILSGPILNNVPRFEGPQSDRDVAEYKRQAGDFANAKKPIATRLAALDAMVTILKKYDKEGKNDWTFGSGAASGQEKTLPNGVTYTFDGKGWKRKQ